MGELNDLLRLIAKETDSDLEDEEKVAAKSVTHAGTERKNDYYPNTVSDRVAVCRHTMYAIGRRAMNVQFVEIFCTEFQS